jgi:hypothetical protein
LHLTFLVAAQNQCVLRRRHVEADDVFELLDKLRIARHLEGLDQVRLESIGLPNLEHRRIGNTEFGRQLACAPVGGPLGRGLRRHAHNLRCVDRRLAPAARQVRFNRGYATFGKSFPPRYDLTPTDFEPPRNLVITHTVGRKEHDSARYGRPASAISFGAPVRFVVHRSD